mmetsp:Transcript_2374/g.5270  ORF Transcript_2374/g.5270 Transcript_2374/m.5270 type:complete len:650 (+) Transcript_2374:61-2010(+)
MRTVISAAAACITLAANLRTGDDPAALALVLNGVTLGDQQGIRLGSAFGRRDVCDKGVVSDGWTPSEPAQVRGSESVLQLFLAVDGAREVAKASAKVVSADASVVSAASPPEVVLHRGLEVALPIVFTCHKPGTGTMSVVINVEGQVPVVVGLNKRCSAHAMDLVANTGDLGRVIDKGSSLWTHSRGVVIPVSREIETLLFSTGEQSLKLNAEVGMVDLGPGYGADKLQLAVDRIASGTATPTKSDDGLVVNVPVNSTISQHGVTAFPLQFHCWAPNTYMVEVTLIPEPIYQPFAPVKLSMLKSCAPTSSLDMTIGSRPKASDLAVKGIPKVSMFDDPVPTLPTTFYVHFIPDVTDETFPKMHVACAMAHDDSVPVTGVKLLDKPLGGNWHEVSAAFDCPKNKTDLKCALTTSPRLRDPFTLYFSKCCDGNPKVEIKSEDFEIFETVFTNGEVTRGWAPDAANGPQMVVPTELDSIKFRITPSIRITDLSNPTVSCGQNCEALSSVEVKGPSQGGRSDIFTVNHVCASAGSALVQLTFASSRGAPISFAWWKECGRGAFAFSLAGMVLFAAIGGTAMAGGFYACASNMDPGRYVRSPGGMYFRRSDVIEANGKIFRFVQRSPSTGPRTPGKQSRKPRRSGSGRAMTSVV